MDIVVFLLSKGVFLTLTDIELERCVRGTNDPEIKEILNTFSEMQDFDIKPITGLDPTNINKLNHTKANKLKKTEEAGGKSGSGSGGKKKQPKKQIRTNFKESLNS